MMITQSCSGFPDDSNKSPPHSLYHQFGGRPTGFTEHDSQFTLVWCEAAGMTVSRAHKAKGGSPAPFQRRLVPSSGEGSGDLHRIDVEKSAELEGKGLGLTPDPHPWLTA